MPKTRINFSAGWTPDLPALNNPGLVRAAGVIPIGRDTFRPVGSWVSTGIDALAEYPRGHFPFRDLDGVGYNFVGTTTKLYRIGHGITPNGLEDVTRASGGPYATSASGRWEFASTRDRIIATNFADAIQTYVSGVSTKFAQLSAAAPKAKCIGFIGPLIVVGNLNDPILGISPDALRSPNIDDPTDWPDPTDPNVAIAAQALGVIIDGDGGPVQQIVSGVEVGCVMQERQLCRVEYVGGDVIVQIDRLEKTRGLLFPRLACAFGRRLLFLAEDGFYLWDYTLADPEAVGERVDRTFLTDLDQTYAHRAIMLKHTRFPVIAIGYPGAGNSGGTPNKIIFWNFKTGRWAGPTTFAHGLLARVLPPALSLDSDPDDVLENFEDSFDDPPNPVGSDQFGAYDTSHVLGTFSGSGMAATFETGDLEHAPGAVARVNSVRPYVDDALPTLAVDVRFDRREGEVDVTFDAERSLNSAGKYPVGRRGRTHRYRFSVPAGGFEEATGAEVEFMPSGDR